jgi:hypothetical protein
LSIIFSCPIKNKIILKNFVIFVARKKGRTTNFIPAFVGVVGSGIRDGLKSGSGIRNKHPGSATLNSLT